MLDISRLLALQSSPLVISLVGGGGKTTTAFWLAHFFKNWGHRVCVTTTTKMYLPELHQSDYIIHFDYLASVNSINDSHSENEKTTSSLAQDSFIFSDPSITFCHRGVIKSKESQNKIKVSGLTFNELSILKNEGNFTVLIIESDGARAMPIKAPLRHEPCIPNDSDMVIGVTGAEAINTPATPNSVHRWSAFSAITQCQQGDVINHRVLNKLISHPSGMFKNAPAHAIKIWLINKLDLHHDTQLLNATAESVIEQNHHLDAIWLAVMTSASPIKKILAKEQFAVAT
ncbi:putative selenium-dependent hydroxylase accessory protein YqeC [Photobacterium sanctipauli]|uniref:Putative selenium-dependent hydroxylase accessory protein YqeC n=2 Tax=Photobacterium sanctipauli TaxID=1342794 RepID=A0A2T3NNW7_9GAMM|nr:putative selenium-dependent hydroxylase accessory protein YqeC [Photobacterium sanctipauli]